MIKKVPLKKLVWDDGVYPREAVDSYHIHSLVLALEAGAILPPIVAQAKTFKGIDGRHRARAYSQFYKDVDNPRVEVDLQEFATDAEMFAAAVQLNAHHGRILTQVDRLRCINRAEEMGMTLETISSLLNMTPDRVGYLKQERTALWNMAPVRLKQTVEHLAGSTLTLGQIDFNRKAGGMRQTFYVNQVIGLIESGSLNRSDPVVMDRLRYLRELLVGELVGSSA